MKKRRFFSVLLILTLLLGGIGVMPVSAAADGPHWKLDFASMSSPTDNGGSREYTLDVRGAALKEFDGATCFAIENGNGHLKLMDTGVVLPKAETFYVDFDIYVDSFPTGTRTRTGGTEQLTPDQYPFALFTWVLGTNYSRSIRIDQYGNLYTSDSASSKINAKIEEKTWYGIRFGITPSSGRFEIIIDGTTVHTQKFATVSGTPASSILRFFDTAYTYTAYVKDVNVNVNDDYIVGASAEKSADYLGWQTTAVKDGHFDVRFLATLDNLDYNKVGYEVTIVTDKDGKTNTERRDIAAVQVYENVRAGGKTVSASSLGAKYLALVTVTGLDADALVELAIRPYVIADGARRYGKADILQYSGKSASGYPALGPVADAEVLSVVPTDDSYIRPNYPVQGTLDSLIIKNAGAGAGTTRFIYLKFTLTDAEAATALTTKKATLNLFTNSCRKATTDEEQAGGILANIYEVPTTWDEKTLTYANAPTRKSGAEPIGTLRYGAGSYSAADLSEYVLGKLAQGERTFALRLEDADYETSAECKMSSKEGKNAPKLVFGNGAAIEHAVNLQKLENAGYEPWGYAEQLVDEWFRAGGDRDILYAETYETDMPAAVDVTKKQGAHTVSVVWRQSHPGGAEHSEYARTVDTLISAEAYSETETTFDEYGGITNLGIKGKVTGFYHAETIGGRPYLIDPLGNPFFCIGANTVSDGWTSNLKKYTLSKFGSKEKFYDSITQTLMDMGVNTCVSGEHASLLATGQTNSVIATGGIGAYMKEFNLSVSTGGSSKFANNNTMNVFDPDFVTFANSRIGATALKYKDEPRLVGYTTDNELPYDMCFLRNYLTLDPANPVNAFSYAAAWTWFIEKTGDPNPSLTMVTADMNSEFKCFVYNRYFKTCYNAIRTVDPNHIYLGARACANNKTDPGYIRAAGRYCEVHSINLYEGMEPAVATLEAIWKYSGKPFIVTEFYAKAADATDFNGQKLANQANAGALVKTQTDRGVLFENYSLLMLESRACVGWVWYCFQDNDQTLYKNEKGDILRCYSCDGTTVTNYINEAGTVIPAAQAGKVTVFYQGQTDTSNLGSNKGIVDVFMEPYPELAASISRISRNLSGLVEFFDNQR